MSYRSEGWFSRLVSGTGVGRASRFLTVGAILVGTYLFISVIISSMLALVVLGLIPYIGIPPSLYVILLLSGLIFFPLYVYDRGTKLWIDQMEHRELTAISHPQLRQAVKKMCYRQDISEPDVIVYNSPVANAFALPQYGTNIVGVSEGLLDELDREELYGVVAHELAHLRNHDAVIIALAKATEKISRQIGKGFGAYMVFAMYMMIAQIHALNGRSVKINTAALKKNAASVGSSVGMIAAAGIILLGNTLSRHREYVADIDAIKTTRNPRAMVSALNKIEQHDSSPDAATEPVPNTLTINSSSDSSSRVKSLFRTHPPIKNRIQNIKEFVKKNA